MRLHTIKLDDIGLPDEWVKIPDKRSFDARTAIDDALAQGLRAFNLARASRYIVEWSFPDEPTEAQILAAEDDVITYILSESEAHYEEFRRSSADRKSDEGAVGSGAGPRAGVAGDGPGRRAAANEAASAGDRKITSRIVG